MKIKINRIKDGERITFDKLPVGIIFFYSHSLYIKLSIETCHDRFKGIKYNAVEIGSGQPAFFDEGDVGLIEIATNLIVDTSPYPV